MRTMMRASLGAGVFACLFIAGCKCCSHSCCDSSHCGDSSHCATHASNSEPVAADDQAPSGSATAAERIKPQYLPMHRQVTKNEPPVSDGSVTQVSESHGQSKEETSAGPTMAHAPDYKWVTGELWYTPTSGWRIHYGNGKDDDHYGGVLTLSDTGPMKDYKIGQLVYVEGQVAEAGQNGSGSVYRVSKMLEVMQK